MIQEGQQHLINEPNSRSIQKQALIEAGIQTTDGNARYPEDEVASFDPPETAPA